MRRDETKSRSSKYQFYGSVSRTEQ